MEDGKNVYFKKPAPDLETGRARYILHKKEATSPIVFNAAKLKPIPNPDAGASHRLPRPRQPGKPSFCVVWNLNSAEWAVTETDSQHLLVSLEWMRRVGSSLTGPVSFG